VAQTRSFERLGRTLSFDPRSRRVAWSYFKDGELQDCRIKTFREQRASVRTNSEIVPYLTDLLDHYSPHAVLVPRISGAGTRRRSPAVAKAIRATVREALKRGIAVHVISDDSVKKAFGESDAIPARNKQEIHEAILEQFPELTMMVPKPRQKIWEPEQYFTPLFNTIAMYLAWEFQLSPMDSRN
jgi:hypothetical protein